jgi:hypothetical protein
MLHEAMINFLRWIVNQTRAFFCRAAAQFNEAPPPNRRPRFPLGSLGEFERQMGHILN